MTRGCWFPRFSHSLAGLRTNPKGNLQFGIKPSEKGLAVNVTIENLAPCKKLLRVEVPSEKVNEAFETVTKDFQKQVSLPGFRPGKAPRDMVVKRFEPQIHDEVKTKLTREGYQDALKEKKLIVVTSSDLEEVQFARGQAYQFVVTVETAPEFDLPSYKGLPAKRPKAQVTDADVDAGLMALREQRVKHETVTREIKEGDVAVVNYKGSCDGQPITALAPASRGIAEQKNFWINVHKEGFIPGFAEQLVGAKAGDKRTVTVTFPADFVTPQLQGKQGTYEVEVVEVKQKDIPDLNEELAKSYGAESVEKLREGVRKSLVDDTTRKIEISVTNQVMEGLLNQVNCDLPESVVKQETTNIVYNDVNQAQQRGATSEDLQKHKEQIYESASVRARNQVKAMFLLGKIAEKEGIKVEQNEAIQRIQQLAAYYDVPLEKYIKELQKQDGGVQQIFDQVLREKVVKFIVDNAAIEEVEAPPRQG